MDEKLHCEYPQPHPRPPHSLVNFRYFNCRSFDSYRGLPVVRRGQWRIHYPGRDVQHCRSHLSNGRKLDSLSLSHSFVSLCLWAIHTLQQIWHLLTIENYNALSLRPLWTPQKWEAQEKKVGRRGSEEWVFMTQAPFSSFSRASS